MQFKITQQESVCQRAISVNYTDLWETETAQYNSLKLQNLEIQISVLRQAVTAVDQDTIKTISESNLLS